MITTRACAVALAVGLVPAVGACDRNEAVQNNTAAEPAAQTTGQALRVTAVELGRAIGAEGRINGHATTSAFRPNDTIYASVKTEGSASGATLVARWTFEDGQVVAETSRTITATGPTVTEFHIARPDGLPAGSYRVEVRLGGQVVDSSASWWRRHRDFEVR